MRVYVDEFHKTVHFAGSYYSPTLLESTQEVEQQVRLDFEQSIFDLKNAKDYRLLVDFGREGQCEKYADHLVRTLGSLGFRDMLVMFNVPIDTQHLPYKAISLPENMIEHEGWFDLLDSVEYEDRVDSKFLCLMRRPTISRARIAAALLQISSIRLSFASSCRPEQLPEYQQYLPGIDLPILLDDYTIRELNSLEHDQRNPIFHSVLFNLVVETSSQTDYNAWKSIFITEKTFKAFGLRQIPVWFAVPGLVSAVRSLGFDVFDDIIDHSYDSMPEEARRHARVIEQIKSLDHTLSLDRCQHLRTALRDRLDKNYGLVKSMLDRRRDKLKNVLENFYST